MIISIFKNLKTMKNDNYKWDNKKPTAQMLGRWQPWHAGHQKLFEEILKKTGQVNIMVRDVQGVDDNPFNFETVKKNILEALKDVFTSDEDRYKVVKNLAYIARADDFIHENEMKMVEKAVSSLDMVDKVNLVKTDSTLFVDPTF